MAIKQWTLPLLGASVKIDVVETDVIADVVAGSLALMLVDADEKRSGEIAANCNQLRDYTIEYLMDSPAAVYPYMPIGAGKGQILVAASAAAIPAGSVALGLGFPPTVEGFPAGTVDTSSAIGYCRDYAAENYFKKV